MNNYEIIDNGKKFKSGRFTPRHPEKYIGNNLDNIIFRSSWELKAFIFLDGNKNVLKWASESIIIPYQKPIITSSGKPTTIPANYFPDLFVQYKDNNENIIQEVIEIKPKKQTKRSRAKKPENKIREDYIFLVNEYKWKYADEWCQKRGINFKLLTEDSIFRF